MKTKEELNELKNEVIAINNKLAELTPDELKLVTGGLRLRRSGDRFIGIAPELPATQLCQGDEIDFRGCEGIEGKGQLPAKEIIP